MDRKGIGELGLVITDQPSDADVAFLDDRLSAFNLEVTGYRDFRKLAVLRRDGEGGIVAGLTGYTWGFVCKVQLLWVDRAMRGTGMGGSLLQAAEVEARARGCSKIVLSTHSFQAPDFYRRYGYEEIAEGQENPRGFSTVYFEKGLEPEARKS